MRILSCDWATKKALKIYDSQKDKIKSIPNTIEDFEKFLSSLDGEKTIMLFEFGGGDTYKIMAFRASHTILQIPGKKIKDYRDSKGLMKEDLIDAKTIYDFFIENGGEERYVIGEKFYYLASSSPFYLFKEQHADIAEIKILFRQHEDIKQTMVREKNKKFAFDQQFKIANVADDVAKKVKFHKDASIVAKERELEQIKKILKKKIRKFPIWQNYLKDVKAVGEVIASGLIGELGGTQFDSDESLKHYAGMVAKSEFHDYNRYLKATLYQFVEGVIRHRTPKWRELYDNMKIYYQKKHEDWSKGKVNNYAKKFIETKFLLEYWKKSKTIGAKEA